MIEYQQLNQIENSMNIIENSQLPEVLSSFVDYLKESFHYDSNRVQYFVSTSLTANDSALTPILRKKMKALNNTIDFEEIRNELNTIAAELEEFYVISMMRHTDNFDDTDYFFVTVNKNKVFIHQNFSTFDLVDMYYFRGSDGELGEGTYVSNTPVFESSDTQNFLYRLMTYKFTFNATLNKILDRNSINQVDIKNHKLEVQVLSGIHPSTVDSINRKKILDLLQHNYNEFHPDNLILVKILYKSELIYDKFFYKVSPQQAVSTMIKPFKLTDAEYSQIERKPTLSKEYLDDFEDQYKVLEMIME